MPPFQKVLIANRGEIAVRVARTCRAMGIATVAVYSEADAGALHARVADEAVPIGPAEAARSYLDIDALLAAARRAGRRRRPSRLRLPEPERRLRGRGGARPASRSSARPGDVHRRMGDKQGARRLMAAAGVPVVPGYDGDDQADATLAARGGAHRLAGDHQALARGRRQGHARRARARRTSWPRWPASRREARAAFGDDVVVLERYVERPRHVEVQVLADDARAASSTSSSASARSSAATRRWSRRRPARPSTPSSAARSATRGWRRRGPPPTSARAPSSSCSTPTAASTSSR